LQMGNAVSQQGTHMDSRYNPPPQSAPYALNPTNCSLNDGENLWEIPPEMMEHHECLFYEQSMDYEDILRDLQLVLLVDHSGSMCQLDEDPCGRTRTHGMVDGRGWTRWDNLFQVSKYLAKSILEYDKDKMIPIIFFGHRAEEKIVHSAGQMLVEFKRYKPVDRQSTNLFDALRIAFERHITHENTLFVVLTDGAPNNGTQESIKRLIQERVASVDPKGHRLNILFLRLGDDPGALSFLQYMDDCQEIGANVDTKSDNAVYQMGPKNLLLNAIYEHLDHLYQHL